MIFAATERLILRRVRADDLEPLMRGWADPEMTRFTSEPPDAHAFLTKMIGDMQAKTPGEVEPGGPWYQFIIERSADGAVVGDLGAGFGIPGERQVELGYRVLPRHHRQGYAREAVAALIEYLIETQRIHRFIGVAATLNTASCALLRSLGFRKEGHFRQSFLCRGEWLDDDYYALLASDWRGSGRL